LRHIDGATRRLQGEAGARFARLALLTVDPHTGQMKLNSPHFDRIRVKPDQDRRRQESLPPCEWVGCANGATHRAPKGRHREGQYHRFCFDHVREYNQNYNYFAGMGDDDVAAYQKAAMTGHRPTWKMGVNAPHPFAQAMNHRGPADASDPFRMFDELGARTRFEERAPQPEARSIRNAERKAFDTLGLDIDADKATIKSRFKELAKRHHPDANGGDRSMEGRLADIIQAYNYLKSAGFC
jgi:DnaJ domain